MTITVRPIPHQKEVGNAVPAPTTDNVSPAIPNSGPAVGRIGAIIDITSFALAVGKVPPMLP